MMSKPIAFTWPSARPSISFAQNGPKRTRGVAASSSESRLLRSIAITATGSPAVPGLAPLMVSDRSKNKPSTQFIVVPDARLATTAIAAAAIIVISRWRRRHRAHSLDMQHDEELGRTSAHRNKSVFERLSRIADPQHEQIAMVGFQGCRARGRGCPLVSEFETVEESIRLPFLIHRRFGNFAGTAPGEDDLGSDRQSQEVARDPPAAGSR